MACRTLLFMLALGIALGPLSGRAEDRAAFRLKSVSVDLPNGDEAFPPGPGVEAVNANCLTCHSAGMVLYQPGMPKAAWETEVQKMINVYKAPIAAQDIPPIVAYLDSIKGTKPSEASPTR